MEFKALENNEEINIIKHDNKFYQVSDEVKLNKDHIKWLLGYDDKAFMSCQIFEIEEFNIVMKEEDYQCGCFGHKIYTEKDLFNNIKDDFTAIMEQWLLDRIKRNSDKKKTEILYQVELQWTKNSKTVKSDKDIKSNAINLYDYYSSKGTYYRVRLFFFDENNNKHLYFI